MSVSKTGWIIAAATAAAFAAGCAGQGQGHMDNVGASCAGESVPVAHPCKNPSDCKTAKVVKRHHRHHTEKVMKKEEETVTKETDNKDNTDKDNDNKDNSDANK